MFADFRIANSQGTGCLKTADQEIHNHTVKDYSLRSMIVEVGLCRVREG